MDRSPGANQQHVSDERIGCRAGSDRRSIASAHGRESPESFRRYLTLEGAPEALERYENEGLLPTDSVTRRYATYAKTIVEVGRGGPRAFARVVGHPLESGGLETRDEYRARHLPGDVAFSRAVSSVRTPLRIVVRGDAAWAWSTSTTQGEFRGRAVNSQGAALMVLSREASGWKIRAIHWSSRARGQP